MIFYFSGTGNSRWVAKQLAEAFSEELVPVADACVSGRMFPSDPMRRSVLFFPFIPGDLLRWF